MRIAVLWTRLSGYLNACLKELASRSGMEILVYHRAPAREAPFDEGQFSWITHRVSWHSRRELETLEDRLQAFAPDIVLFAGWHIGAYRKAAASRTHKCWRVMAMDNCWRGTFRQRAAILASRFFLGPIADAVWVPGERQAVFARRLGFEEGRILRGLYSCDQPVFAALYRSRVADAAPLPRAFLYVGRFVPEKGIGTLLDAYGSYRRMATLPWSLICCGAGPLRSRLAETTGVRLEDFVQPQKLGEQMASAGCLIAPSAFEPWSVAVHEAASAGLIVLASEKVGAAVHLVQPTHNGFIFGHHDAWGLAQLMLRVSRMSPAQLEQMSEASYALSRQYSPQLWADTLLHSFQALQQPRPAHSLPTRYGPNFGNHL